MTGLGLYVPRDSALHRAPAGVKLAGLLLAGAAVFLIRDARVLLGLLAAAGGLYALAGFGWRASWRQLRPSLGFLLLFFVLQGLFTTWEQATVTALRFAVMVLLASLVTLSTRVSALLETLERALRPLARFGVNPVKVSLACSLTLRFIPVIAQTLEEVRDAQRARGTEKSLLALAVPVVVRTLKLADDVADAIDARSFHG